MALPPWLRTQLSGPSGWLARPMAHLLNRGNADLYKSALKALDAHAGESVLELGFGGGIGVKALLADGVHVIAAEPSVAMRERAFRHFSWALAEGALEILPSSAETLPDIRVDHALSLNTVYFWDDIDAGFANLRRVVKTRVVFGIGRASLLLDMGFGDSGFRTFPIEWYAEQLEKAGFEATIVRSDEKLGQSDLLIGT